MIPGCTHNKAPHSLMKVWGDVGFQILLRKALAVLRAIGLNSPASMCRGCGPLARSH